MVPTFLCLCFLVGEMGIIFFSNSLSWFEGRVVNISDIIKHLNFWISAKKCVQRKKVSLCCDVTSLDQEQHLRKLNSLVVREVSSLWLFRALGIVQLQLNDSNCSFPNLTKFLFLNFYLINGGDGGVRNCKGRVRTPFLIFFNLFIPTPSPLATITLFSLSMGFVYSLILSFRFYI